MTVCSGLVTYQAYDAPDSEKTKWAVAVGHALYHLFIVGSIRLVHCVEPRPVVNVALLAPR